VTKKIAFAFAVGLAVGIVLSVIARTLTQGGGPFAPNRRRDVPAMIDSGYAWAGPINRPGVGNFHRVSETMFRGAQPTAEGMRVLQSMGIRTIVNLRRFHSDRDELGDTPLRYERITFNTTHPERRETVRFLQLATTPSLQPIYVHCKHGSDRTGLMVAAYRVAVEGWPVE